MLEISHTFKAAEDDAGKRLDSFLAEQFELTRSAVQKHIRGGEIFVNQKLQTKTGYAMRVEDVVSRIPKEDVADIEPPEQKLVSVDKPIVVVEETKDYLVVNKPSGLLVHPTQAMEEDSLAARLIHHYPKIKKIGESLIRPGIVHRLDKDASGLMVVAKTQKMFLHLKKQFQQRETFKEYEVLVHGKLDKKNETIDFDIDRGKEGRMVARPKTSFSLKNVPKIQDGKEAITEYSVKTEFARFTLLTVKILTGRTHQIRVHMFAYGHPVVGDILYINRKLNLKRDEALGRIFLHAKKLVFKDLSNKEHLFEAELPEKLTSFLETL
jgi:23S rRNA pseudouridine1911/1915/1917 synthase